VDVGVTASTFRVLARDALEALFPPVCPLCGAASDEPRGPAGGCSAHTLPDPSRPPAGPRCHRCARELPPALPDGARCAVCRRRPPRVQRVVALGDYRSEAGLRAWILALKHGGRDDLALPLGRALAERLRRTAGTELLLVPVPLHPLRRLERGYDQGLLLARAAGDALGATVRPLLRRRRWTAPQGAIGAVSRRANVRRAFRPRPGAAPALRGVAVWLVDDVVTSGATADACARALGRLGAGRVSLACLGRAGSEAEGPDGDADVDGRRGGR
jgi:predicted amidophosphoribosyltransferase